MFAVGFLSRSLSAASAEPVKRFVTLSPRKVPHFGLNEVLGDGWGKRQHGAVAQGSDALDLPVMVAHKFQVCHQRRQVFPAGERLGIDQDSMQFAVRFEIGIDLLRDPLKVGGLQR